MCSHEPAAFTIECGLSNDFAAVVAVTVTQSVIRFCVSFLVVNSVVLIFVLLFVSLSLRMCVINIFAKLHYIISNVVVDDDSSDDDAVRELTTHYVCRTHRYYTSTARRYTHRR